MKRNLLSTLSIMPIFLPTMISAKCNAVTDAKEFQTSDIESLYKETAKNAKYTIHFMQHGGYPIGHQINSIIYLDKESNGKNKQIMYWANANIDKPDNYNDIKGYNHKALSDYYNLVPFKGTKSLTNPKNNNKGNIYFVKENAKRKFDQYQEIAEFIKAHPQEVDFSLTFLEWYKYLLQPQHAMQLYDILLNVRKIIIISDGTAQASLFEEAYKKYKSELASLSTEKINKIFDDYKHKKMTKDEFAKNSCRLMWNYIDKKVNGVPFITLVNYDVSYLEHDDYKLPNLKQPWSAFQPVFLGKYGEWNQDAKPIIESVIAYPQNQPLFSKKSSKFDPKKKTAVFMGDSFFRELEIGPDGKKHTRLLDFPNALAETRKIFKSFAKRYDSSKYNIVFKMHPRFDEEYNIEYVKLISDGAIKEDDLNIINSKLSWENIMTNELIKFKNNPNAENLLFKNKDNLFDDFVILGMTPLSTVVQTTMMFVYTESNYSTDKILDVVNPKNFPIPKKFYNCQFMTQDSKDDDDYSLKNREESRKFFNKYKLVENLKFTELMPDVD